MDKYEMQLAQQAVKLIEQMIAYANGRNDNASLRRTEFKLVFDKSLNNDTAHSQLNQTDKSITATTILSKKGVDEMPLYYTDGSFRNIRNTLQYRFYFNGRQVSVYGKSKEECYQLRAIHALEPRKVKEKKKIIKENPTYREWTKEWIELYKRPNIESEYMSQIVGQLKNHIYPAFGRFQMSEINGMDIQKFLIGIKSDNLRTKISSILSESFSDAQLVGIIKNNPYQGIKIKRYRPPRVGALTHMQQLKMLRYTDNNFDAEKKIPIFVRALLMTGMRQAELNALQAKNVDFMNNEIIVETSWKRKDKKLGEPKTSTSNRVIPIASPLKFILQRLVNNCNNSEERLFGWDNQDYTYRFLSRILKAIKTNFTGHITRHTFITNAFELGFPQYLVQQWAGHTEQLQTQDYLGIRRKSDYIETEVTEYMKQLKQQTVLKM